jgi:hypothetical protein
MCVVLWTFSHLHILPAFASCPCHTAGPQWQKGCHRYLAISSIKLMLLSLRDGSMGVLNFYNKLKKRVYQEPQNLTLFGNRVFAEKAVKMRLKWIRTGPTQWFFFLMGLGFEIRDWCLQSRCFTTWATPPVHFGLVILELGVSWTVCLSDPQTLILPISASQVARIIGISH